MKKIYIPFVAILCILHACNTDFEDIKVPINTTLPLADFKISDTTLLSWAGLKDDVTTGENGVLEISKTMSMTIGTAEDLKTIFTLNNQFFTFSYNFGGTIPSPIEIKLDPPVQLEQKFSLPNDYSINYAILDAGELTFNITNSNSDFSNVACVVEQLTLNGTPLTIRRGERKSLKGYKLAFADNESKINFALSGTIQAVAGDNLSNVGINITFTNLRLSQAQGFFGRSVITPNEEFTIQIDPSVVDFFENCEYYLSNPKVHLQLDNAYDLPILIQISKLKIGNQEIQLKNQIGSSKIFLKPQHITEYKLDNASTVSGMELSDALSKDITSFTIGFTIITNPTKADLEDNNYTPPTTNNISLDKNIKIHERFSIPIEGTFTDIPFNQEFTMGLEEDDNRVYDYLKLAVTCTNEMPFNLKFNIVAIAADNAETVLFNNAVTIPSSNGASPNSSDFQAGIINESNVIIQNIQGNNVKAMLEAKSLRFEFNGSMPQIPGRGYSKLYSPSSLQLKLIGNLKGEF